MSELLTALKALLAPTRYRLEQWQGMGDAWQPVTDWGDSETIGVAIRARMAAPDPPHLYRLLCSRPDWTPVQFIPTADSLLIKRDQADFISEADLFPPTRPGC